MNDKKLRWKSLGSSYILDTRWLKVRKDAVRLPDGKVLDDFHVIEGGELVAIVAIDDGNNILLVKQYRHAVEDITIDLPGGSVEKGEEPLGAAKRELAEETGFIAGQLQHLLSYYPDSGKTTSKKHIILATDLKKDDTGLYTKDAAENIELIRIPLETLVEKGVNQEVGEATLYIGVHAYLNYLQNK